MGRNITGLDDGLAEGLVYKSKVITDHEALNTYSDLLLRKQAGAASLQTPAAPLKLSDTVRDLAYEEMKAMAMALDEEPQAEGEMEEEAEWIGNNLWLPIVQ